MINQIDNRSDKHKDIYNAEVGRIMSEVKSRLDIHRIQGTDIEFHKAFAEYSKKRIEQIKERINACNR